MVVREETTVQPHTPSVCCDSHTYGGLLFFITTLIAMTINKIEKATSLKVSEGLTVTVYPTSDYGFLITTTELAKAYGRSVFMVYKAVERAGKRLTCSHTLNYIKSAKYGLNIGTRSVLWTMEGFFFIGEFFRTGNLEAIKNFKEVCQFKVQSKIMGGR